MQYVLRHYVLQVLSIKQEAATHWRGLVLWLVRFDKDVLRL